MREKTPALALYPYQRQWLADKARFKIGMFARQTGKTFYGIEREEKYFDIACERIERAYAQQRLFA